MLTKLSMSLLMSLLIFLGLDLLHHYFNINISLRKLLQSPFENEMSLMAQDDIQDDIQESG